MLFTRNSKGSLIKKYVLVQQKTLFLLPSFIFSRIEMLKRTGSWLTTPMCSLNAANENWSSGRPEMKIVPDW